MGKMSVVKDRYSQRVTPGWRLQGVTRPGDGFLVAGHDIWARRWLDMGRTIVAFTPGRSPTDSPPSFPLFVPVHRLDAEDDRTTFAAIEFAPGAYAIYVPTDAMS